MQKKFNKPERNRKYINLETVFLLITIFISVLIYNLYVSSASYRIVSANSHKAYTNKLSWTLAYFFVERKTELEKATTAGNVAEFFKNKQSSSKQLLVKEMNKLLQLQAGPYNKAFESVYIIDKFGKVLISNEELNKKHFPIKTLPSERISIKAENINGTTGINIYIPFRDNKKLLGYAIAKISPAAIKQHIKNYNTDTKYRISLISEENNILFSIQDSSQKQITYKLQLNELKDNEVQKFKAFSKNDKHNMLAVKIPIKNTNLAMLNMIELDPVIAGAKGGYFFVYMAVASIFVIGGCYILARILIKNKILSAMLKERDVNHETLTAKNKQLEDEINTHKKSKEALLRAKKSTDELIRQLQEAVKREQKLAQDANLANRAKSEFFANMSHELKTPLQGILGFADFGLQKYNCSNPESIKEYFKQIKICGENLHKLIVTLLEIVRIETDKIDFKFQPVNAAMLVAMVIDEFSQQSAEKNINIKFELPEHNEKLTLDTYRIQTVIRNILDNAIKYSPENSTIEVDIDYKQDSALISISDQGPGIPQQELDTVLNAFEQSTRTNKGAGGSGLGLCLCNKIIQKHNGRIWAENIEHGGAEINIELPSEQVSSTNETEQKTALKLEQF